MSGEAKRWTLAFNVIRGGWRVERYSGPPVAMEDTFEVVESAALEAAERERDELRRALYGTSITPDGALARAERAEAQLRELVEALQADHATYVCAGCGGDWPCGPSEFDSRHTRTLNGRFDALLSALASGRDGEENETD